MASPHVFNHNRMFGWRPNHDAQDKMRQYAQMRLNYAFIRQHGPGRVRNVLNQLAVDEYLELSHFPDAFSGAGALMFFGQTASA